MITCKPHFHQTLPPYISATARFNSTSATDKFYWLLATLDAVQQQKLEVKKEELFASMLSNAWYTINYLQISFGQQDLIQSTLRQLKSIEGINIDGAKSYHTT